MCGSLSNVGSLDLRYYHMRHNKQKQAERIVVPGTVGLSAAFYVAVAQWLRASNIFRQLG